MNLIPDDMDFSSYMQEQEFIEVRSASDYLDETLNLAFPDPNLPKPPVALWAKTAGKMVYRPCEVTLWAGINGHGKSMFLSQIILDLMLQKQKVLVISLEMTPAAQMLRMSKQSYGGDPTKDWIIKLHQNLDESLWIYNQTGQVSWKKVMAVCRYAEEKFGIQHFVIDSLMKVVRGEDDKDGQKDFIEEVCRFAMSKKKHVHIVHHVRKGESEDKIPDKFDIRGSSAIIDQVDNINIVFWNKKNSNLEQPDRTKPTAAIKICKNRHGNFEGVIGFWYHQESNQYLEKIDDIPKRYNFNKR